MTYVQCIVHVRFRLYKVTLRTRVFHYKDDNMRQPVWPPHSPPAWKVVPVALPNDALRHCAANCLRVRFTTLFPRGRLNKQTKAQSIVQ